LGNARPAAERADYAGRKGWVKSRMPQVTLARAAQCSGSGADAIMDSKTERLFTGSPVVQCRKLVARPSAFLTGGRFGSRGRAREHWWAGPPFCSRGLLRGRCEPSSRLVAVRSGVATFAREATRRPGAAPPPCGAWETPRSARTVSLGRSRRRTASGLFSAPACRTLTPAAKAF